MISNGGKLEKSALSFLLTHRLATPHRGVESSTRNSAEQPGLLAASGIELNVATEQQHPESSCNAASNVAGVQQSMTEERRPQGEGDADDGAGYSENCADLALTVPGPEARSVELSRSHISVAPKPRVDLGLSDSHDGLSSSQTSWCFSQATNSGMSGSAIAMQDFRGNSDPEAGYDDSLEVCEALKILPVWGYPLGALWFVHDLEEFQQREVSDSCADRELYALMPDEFLTLPRVAPSASEDLVGLRSCNGVWTMQDEMEKCVCGPHYFWIEMLYEFHSGRRVSLATEANDLSSWSSNYEHAFDIEHSWQAQRAQNSGGGCAVQ
jgi:hypothetical protein